MPQQNTIKHSPRSEASTKIYSPPQKQEGNNWVEKRKKSSAKSANMRKGSPQNVEKKMLVCQKTNVRKFADYHSKKSKEINYKNDKTIKPPYSYAALICLALIDIGKKCMLKDIYQWIKKNFAYYHNAEQSWQVRHDT